MKRLLVHVNPLEIKTPTGRLLSLQDLKTLPEECVIEDELRGIEG